MNSICITGRLTKKPELKTTSTGIEVCVFCVAVDRRYKDANGEKVTDFIDCKAWNGTAVFIEKYFDKGKMIAITGDLRVENYTDKDGNKRKWVYVNVDAADFCGSKSDSTEQASTASSTPASVLDIEDDEELPF